MLTNQAAYGAGGAHRLAKMDPCPHLTVVGEDPAPRSTTGCTGCLAEDRADWVQLRLCLGCGFVGCCNSSPARHANAHAASTAHPVVRSLQPGASWRWCYVDEAYG